ncbi:hypothetical protein ABK040_008157 [Willaertia magna]
MQTLDEGNNENSIVVNSIENGLNSGNEENNDLALNNNIQQSEGTILPCQQQVNSININSNDKEQVIVEEGIVEKEMDTEDIEQLSTIEETSHYSENSLHSDQIIIGNLEQQEINSAINLKTNNNKPLPIINNSLINNNLSIETNNGILDIRETIRLDNKSPSSRINHQSFPVASINNNSNHRFNNCNATIIPKIYHHSSSNNLNTSFDLESSESCHSFEDKTKKRRNSISDHIIPSNHRTTSLKKEDLISSFKSERGHHPVRFSDYDATMGPSERKLSRKPLTVEETPTSPVNSPSIPSFGVLESSSTTNLITSSNLSPIISSNYIISNVNTKLEVCDKPSSILRIPDDLYLYIFSFIGFQYVEDNGYNLVCKRWYLILCQDLLWKERYFNLFNSRSIQNNAIILTHIREFNSLVKNRYRYNLIKLKRKKEILKNRLLLQNRYEKSRIYLLFNSFVINPFVSIICFIISTIAFGLQEDEIIEKNDTNILLFVFLPFLVSFIVSIIGSISLGLRETIFCKMGFYDLSHFIHYFVILIGKYTFYFCTFVYGLKWFYFKTTLWTVATIPCICLYILFIGISFGFILNNYIKRRIEFNKVKKKFAKCQQGEGDLNDFLLELRAYKRFEYYSRSKYIIQPFDEQYIDFSEDDDEEEEEIEYESSTDESSTGFDDTTFDNTTSSNYNRRKSRNTPPRENFNNNNTTINNQTKRSIPTELVNLIKTRQLTDISTITLFCSLMITAVMIGFEMLLIPMKMDGIISSSWGAVFLPIWLIMVLVLCGSPIWVIWELSSNTILDKKTIETEESKAKTKDERQCAFFAFSVIPVFIFAPLFVGLIVLAATLEGATVPYSQFLIF